MLAEYDFAKSSPNPYAIKGKKQITIQVDEETLTYFKDISESTGIPWQSLISLYLRDCATINRKLNLNWQ